MTLPEFLRAGAARPFVWGEADCCTFACDWVRERLGSDPAATWRGRYATARGARRFIRRRGLGLIAPEAFRAAGLLLTMEPMPGDVGVIVSGQDQALAIRTPTGWACKGPAGITVFPFLTLSAWTHPCLRS